MQSQHRPMRLNSHASSKGLVSEIDSSPRASKRGMLEHAARKARKNQSANAGLTAQAVH
jgi:hypothetical protein